jgi:hypothetical protein
MYLSAKSKYKKLERFVAVYLRCSEMISTSGIINVLVGGMTDLETTIS